MSRPHEAEIRDRRRKNWFSLDNEVIDRFGPEIGVHGIAVYTTLARLADANEQSHPSLSYLCKLLKIGRRKLLDTLADLKRCGLIEINPGDRSHVSVYTLLSVPKRGEKQSEGGSDENQGGSDENQLGGSDQNCKKTQREQNLIEEKKRREEEKNQVAFLDPTIRDCVTTLSEAESWTKSPVETAEMITDLSARFPQANPVRVCQEFRFALKHGSRKYKNFPNALQQFFRTANDCRGDSSNNGRYGERNEGYDNELLNPSGPLGKKNADLEDYS